MSYTKQLWNIYIKMAHCNMLHTTVLTSHDGDVWVMIKPVILFLLWMI